MGSGWHEWPLMVFTVLGQCVVGGLYCSRSGTDIRWFESRATTAGSPQHVCALGADGTGFYRLYTAFRFANAGVQLIESDR